MNRERWEGEATFIHQEAPTTGAITIQRVQSYRNLVTIEGLGQGKVTFNREGHFDGTWALGDHIHDVSGRADGDWMHWHGTFEIHSMDGQSVARGSFNVNRVLPKHF